LLCSELIVVTLVAEDGVGFCQSQELRRSLTVVINTELLDMCWFFSCIELIAFAIFPAGATPHRCVFHHQVFLFIGRRVVLDIFAEIGVQMTRLSTATAVT
jgi:hypothetical protein